MDDQLNKSQMAKDNSHLITIMVADDHPFIRQALKILLQSQQRP
jgi:hypothetical protein